MKMILPATMLLVAALAYAQTDTTRTPPPDTTRTPKPAPRDTTRAPAQKPAPTPATQTATSASVKRAQFCTNVTEREPVDELTTLSGPADRVFFFTELIGLSGQTVTHKWTLDDQSLAEVPITVGGDRWRCYSTKTLGGVGSGTLKVTVVDGSGSTLAEKTLAYTAGAQ